MYRCCLSVVWQTEAGLDQMHFCGTADYVRRQQSTFKWKTDKTHTCTVVHSCPLSGFHWNCVTPRPYWDKRGVKTCFLNSLENILFSKSFRPKTNPCDFLGLFGSGPYRFFLCNDKCIMFPKTYSEEEHASRLYWFTAQ